MTRFGNDFHTMAEFLNVFKVYFGSVPRGNTVCVRVITAARPVPSLSRWQPWASPRTPQPLTRTEPTPRRKRKTKHRPKARVSVCLSPRFGYYLSLILGPQAKRGEKKSLSLIFFFLRLSQTGQRWRTKKYDSPLINSFIFNIRSSHRGSTSLLRWRSDPRQEQEEEPMLHLQKKSWTHRWVIKET